MTVYIVGLLYRTIWLGGLMFWATFVSHCVGRFYFRPLHPSAWAKAKIVNYVIQHEEMLNQKKKKTRGDAGICTTTVQVQHMVR